MSLSVSRSWQSRSRRSPLCIAWPSKIRTFAQLSGEGLRHLNQDIQRCQELPRHTAKGADWIYTIHPPTQSEVDQNKASLSEV